MSNPDSRLVHPRKTLHGTVAVPGDKSISHRVAMLSALASDSGCSTINGFLASEDCVNTLKAVESLGADVSRTGTKVFVVGTGGTFKEPCKTLDMGNSGTGIRLMAGLLAGQPFASEMTGDASLRSRPMRRIKEPLEMMGAKVELSGEKGCAPVRISGGKLHGIEYKLPVASAQVKSCVLLAGLFGEGRTVVIEPAPTRDHTERMMRAMGIKIEVDGLRISVEGQGEKGPSIQPRTWLVPADFSSAAFWVGAVASREGCEATVRNVGLNPRRTAFLDVLRRMGADIEVRDQRSEVGSRKSEIGGKPTPSTINPSSQHGGIMAGHQPFDFALRRSRSRQGGPLAISSNEWEPVGDIIVRGRKLKGTEVGGFEIPNLIDELPMVAIVGALAEGRTVIRDAKELRVKESNRISTVCAGLRQFGVKVEEKPDGMVVTGATKISGGIEIDSFGDHRIAMGMAVLTLFADAPVRIMNVACIATSYPEFWNHMENLAGKND